MKTACLTFGVAAMLIGANAVPAADRTLDMEVAEKEVRSAYGKADPEVQEFVLLLESENCQSD